MKTIASLKGPDFLRAVNKVRHEAARFVADTGVLKIRDIMPQIPEGATEEEKNQLFAEQGKKNLSAMLDRLLDEQPEKTYTMLCSLIVPDEGEELDGFDLIGALFELLGSQKCIDFFIRLASSVGLITGD